MEGSERGGSAVDCTLSRRAGVVALSVSSLLTPPPLAAQGQEPREGLVFSTDVSLVLLPVFVIGPDGKAMRGLAREDFSVSADGKPAEVVSFRYVDTTDRDEQDELRLAPAARRRFLLLFDKSFTELDGLARAQRAASEFVRSRLAPSDLAAVATFDINRGIRIVASFTEDRALLAHAVQTLGVPALTRIRDPLGLAIDTQTTDIATSGASGDNPTPQPLLDSIAAVLVRQMRAAESVQYRSHAETLARSLEDLARGLRGVEGRKQVLFFSAGFDSRFLVGEEGSERAATALSITEGRLWEVDGVSRHGDSRLRDMLAAATRSLAGTDTVVHAVDVTGLGEQASVEGAAAPQDSLRAGRGRESLNVLAADTGGRLFLNANDLSDALSEMLEMTSRYYVLGVQPGGAKGPDQYHRLKVKAARKGARLSHRPGYYEKSTPARRTVLQRQFEAAELVVAGAGADRLPFSSLCLPLPAPGGRQALGLVVQVPRESLRWGESGIESLELYAYLMDPEGSVKDHLAKLVRVEPAQVDPRGERRGISFYGALSVAPGRYSLRLMLQERESGRSGVQVLEVAVPPYDPTVGFLLPPLLVDPAESWLRVDMTRGAEGRVASPFELDGEPFVPRASALVASGTPEKMVLFALEPRIEGDPAADIEIWSSLLDRDGVRSAPGRLQIDKVLHGERGHRTYVLGFTPEVAKDGDYTLRVGIGESGSLLESFARLRVR